MMPTTDAVAAALPAVVDRIVRRFDPIAVLLFGSHARGDVHRHSDVDLLVVLEHCPDPHRAAIAIDYLFEAPMLGRDVVVTTPEEVGRLGHRLGLIYRQALREGRLLYARPRADLGWWATSKERTMDRDEIIEETRRWLNQAHEDLEMAVKLLQPPDRHPSGAAYYAQQAAEKALKAALIWNQTPFPFVHHLSLLRDLLPPDWRTRRDFPDLKQLGYWSVQGRYPPTGPPATELQAQDAIAQARALYAATLADLADQGFAHGSE